VKEIDEWTLPGSTTVEFRRPADPQLPESARTALASAIADAGGVLEAHLPVMASADGKSGPARQVLVLVIEKGHTAEAVMQSVGPKLVALVPPGLSFDVMPLPEDHKYLGGVRKAASQIFGAPRSQRSWWQFWS
jgi:hypothetical protein